MRILLYTFDLYLPVKFPSLSGAAGHRLYADAAREDLERQTLQPTDHAWASTAYSAASPGASIISRSRLSISCMARPAMPWRSPYSPAVESSTPLSCSSRLAHSRIMVLR